MITAPSAAPSFAPSAFREDAARGPEDPPRGPRRRREGGPPGEPPSWRGQPDPPSLGFIERFAPWVALATMTLAIAMPHADGFPDLGGRETWPLVGWIEDPGLRRVPGAVAAAAAVLLTYGGLQSATSRLAAFLTAAMLAAAPPILQAALQANGDGFGLLASVATLLALCRIVDPDRKPARWPAFAIWGSVASTAPMGDPSVLFGLVTALPILWSTEDRDGLRRLLHPAAALPGLILLVVALVWTNESPFSRIPPLGPNWATGLLAAPFLLLPALPLMSIAWGQLLPDRMARARRIAFFFGFGPLLILITLPWSSWPAALALPPAVFLFVSLALAEGDATGRNPPTTRVWLAQRLLLGVWVLVAGGAALALLTFAGGAPAVAIEAVGALCAIALGVMWGWQGRRYLLALSAVMTSSLLCAAAMEAVSTGMIVIGTLSP